MPPFDRNEGAGFWWANSLNTFTRNVATGSDRYGFRYEATPSSRLKLVFRVQQPDGSCRSVDIRMLPFVRFEGNEAHSSTGLYGVNLGEGVGRVGPDARHPFVVRDLKIWDVHYAFRPQVPALLAESVRIHRAAYGVYHPNYDRHVYRDLLISQTHTEPFNRGHDDLAEAPLTGDESRVAEVNDVALPKVLDPVDDLPPTTVITHTRRRGPGVVVRGTTADNGTVRRVVVNGQEARAVGANFSEWEVTLTRVPAGELRLRAHAEDAAGNVEKRPHVVTVR